jgi:SAM-dependent methyltransferase
MMRSIVTLLCSFALTASALAQDPYKPVVGQAGKDVVWVPTPPELVEKMLDLAKVTADDFVVDLGSGDGRNVIAAARRGARALGVEFNSDMVALSKRLAAEAGVSERASFVEGDMYEADISQATVMALFLLPSNMNRLEPKFLNLRPGTRIVGNTFGFDDWEPDVREVISGVDCASWCTALLWIVPAKAWGTWAMAEGTLSLQQSYQRLSGTLTTKAGAVEIANGRVRGEHVEFIAGGLTYAGRVTGGTMQGTVTTPNGSRPWTARKQPPQ